MTRIPDLWWSPSEGLFLWRPGALSYTPVLDGREQQLIDRRSLPELPADAVELAQHHVGERYPGDSEVIAKVLYAASRMKDSYPALGRLAERLAVDQEEL